MLLAVFALALNPFWLIVMGLDNIKEETSKYIPVLARFLDGHELPRRQIILELVFDASSLMVCRCVGVCVFVFVFFFQ